MLVALEVVLRLISPEPLKFAHDARQIYRYHPRWYIDFIPKTATQLHLAGADGGSSLNFPISINEQGFREPERPASHLATSNQEAAVGGKRLIHAIGDSFTMGWGVDFESSYPAKLEKLLGTDVAVLNLGLNGFGAIGATEKSLSLIDTLPADAVIYLATENDYDDDKKAAQHAERSLLVHRGLSAINWFRRHSFVAGTPFALRRWLRFDPMDENRPQLLDISLPRQVTTIPQGSTNFSNPSMGAATKKALLSYWNDLQQREIHLVVVLHGDGPVVQDLAAFCIEQDIPLDRIAFPQSLLLPSDGHLNPAGNQALAEHLEPWARASLDLAEPHPARKEAISP